VGPSWEGLRWERTGPLVPSPVAVSLTSQALAASPDDLELRRRLGRLLYEAAEWDEAIALLTATAEGDAVCTRLVGASALAGGRLDLAVEALDRAMHLGDDRALADLIEAIARRDGRTAALPLARDALDADPHGVRALAVVTAELRHTRQAEELDALCTDLARRGVGHAGLYAAWASAKALLGDEAGVHAIIDPRLLSVTELDVTPGPADEFNERLAEELLGHPHRARTNPRKAASGGDRVLVPCIPSAVAFASLAGALRDAVERYTASLVARRSRPALAVPSGAVELDPWAVIMSGGDHETWHIHPAALISGVYYVSVPPRDDGARAGTLEFGLLGPDDASLASGPWPRTVEPAPGMLLLFPSSFAHRTIPTGSSEARISVAFDVVAVP
jgi:uncharacterized protein (TIGR02466 family)